MSASITEEMRFIYRKMSATTGDGIASISNRFSRTFHRVSQSIRGCHKYKSKLRRPIANKAIFILLVIVGLSITAIALGLVFGLQYTVTRTNGAIVSNGRGCAEIGGQMLDNGGSAVDATIAILLCEGVMLPQSMGLGGGFVGTIYTKSTGKVETIIARESAPAAAHKNMYVGIKDPKGAITTAVPGDLLGYWEMHKKYGRLPWKDLFEPTIKLCKEGHWVSDFLDKVLKLSEAAIRAESTMAEIFIKEDGTIYKEGDYIKRPQLGKTLEILAEKGAAELYDGGEIAKMFVEDIQASGGIITMDDLKNYKVHWEDGNHATANISNEYTLYSTPLPSSGPLLAFMLNVMNELYTSDEEIYWQRLIETFKHAYGRRSYLGDMTYDPEMASTILETLNEMKNGDFVKHIRSLIYDNKTSEDINYYGANFTIEADHGTANVAVLASNGDAVVITSTVNKYLGALVRSKRTGIILNDEMDDFSTPGESNIFDIPPSPANYIKPGKRPMSSMCPSIVLDKKGDVRMVVGAAGGSKITSTLATVILKYLVQKKNINEAINNERMHHQLLPMYIEVESEVPHNFRRYLENVGHKLKILEPGTGFSAVTAIGYRDKEPVPWYDKRRIGSKYLIQDKNKMRH